jgi:RsiW-degrading membrane proteinase PrsW (M82 family)
MMNQTPQPPAPDLARTIAYVPTPNRRAISWLGAVAGLLVALVAGLIILLLIGVDIFSQGGANGGIALLAGLSFAMVPVPVYVMLVLWIDRYEAEPPWLLATAFLWGATIAAFIAFLVNSIGGALVTATFDEATGHAFGAVVSAPIVEESAKATVLFVLFFWKKDEFDGIVDGIVYASMVALGFAMTENIKYYAEAALGGGQMFTATFILRGAMSPFAHPLFTSMTGIGLGWSRQSDNKLVKYLMPPLGFMTAILMHATWNLSAMLARSSGLLFLLIYFLVMVPVFVAAIVVVIFGLRREGRIVSQFLRSDLETGLLTNEEYSQLCSVRGRLHSSFQALTSQGFSGWRTRRRINQIASELAFLRSRAARGFYRDREQALNQEIAYVNELFDLRRRLNGG